MLHQSPGQVEAFRALTCYAESARTAEESPRLVARALQAALGHSGGRTTHRPRPADGEIPFDLLDGAGEVPPEPWTDEAGPPPRPRPPRPGGPSRTPPSPGAWAAR